MLTSLSSAFCCDSPKKGVIDDHPEVAAIKNGNLQNIAKAIDILSGFALIAFAIYKHYCAAPLYKHSLVLGICGALQLWPLAAFLTTVLYECKERRPKGDIVIVLKPCCCTQR